MATATLATYGGLEHEAGYSGQVADSTPAKIDSYINESATAVDYGRAVARGAAVTGKTPNCKPVGADGDEIVGISVRNPLATATTDGNNTINYPRYSPVPVMTIGRMFVVPFEAVRAGDQVLSITAQGGRLGSSVSGAAGSGRIAVPGARWLTTTAAEAVGKIEIIDTHTGRTTT